MQLLPAQDQSAAIARSILRAWCRGDRRYFRSNLDRALKTIAATPAETSLQEERQELLEGVTWELLQSSAESVSGSDLESIATCIALLRHLSSTDQPPRRSIRHPG
jgi:hypothetical protein